MTATLSQQVVTQFIRDNLLGYSTAQFPDFKPGRHHKLLAAKLEDVAVGRSKRLAVLMAPRHGKSKLSSELFPSWYLGHHPSQRILSLSYGQDLADVFGRSVRNYMRTPTFGALFPECQLSSDSNSIKRFNTNAGGGYATIGVGGATTGRGADLLIMDDLIKDREQADSPVYREHLIDWYKSVARTRLQPGGSIVLVQTRWQASDFVAWLLAETSHEGWQVISLPAIALDSDPLGRQPGEALWPEAYPLSALEEIRTTLGSRDWSSLYQQCPISDADVIFNPQWVQYHYGIPRIETPQIIHSWDLSFGGTSSGHSWVVGQAWAFDMPNRRCYLMQMIREQMGFNAAIAAIRSLNEQYPASRILVENKANGPAVIECLEKEIPYLEAVLPKGGKSDRAYAVTPMFERGEVFLPDPDFSPWIKSLLIEMQSFPMSQSDDCVDAMTQALKYYQEKLHLQAWWDNI
ncbi:MAG: phage terminase large subunit [Aphanocapsa sp. GSE-SYN-MK-11-07L]|jgi:predicted phage terminase large subunit-like protein|nr:phage terminase large subunit [Aphanocapsa sp. GSE-SYN-MK-11-07L]